MKNPPANAGGVRGAGSIPGSGRPPRGGSSNPLQSSCLESPLDRGAWRATVHGVAKRGAGSIPGSGRPPRGGSSNPLQSSCLESPLDRGAWRATVHGVAKSQTRLKRLSTHAPDEQISESHTRAQSQGHLSNVRGRDQVDSGARHKDLPPNPGSSGSRAALSRRTGSSRPPQNAVPTC